MDYEKRYYDQARERADEVYRTLNISAPVESSMTRFFWCRRAERSDYSFSVIFASNAIFVYGDILDMALFPGVQDSLAWLLQSIDDMSYVLEKLGHNREKRKQFDVHLATQVAKEFENQHKRREWMRLDHFDAPEILEREWHRIAGEDQPACKVWESQTLWQYHALRHFVRVYRSGPDLSGVKLPAEALKG